MKKIIIRAITNEDRLMFGYYSSDVVEYGTSQIAIEYCLDNSIRLDAFNYDNSDSLIILLNYLEEHCRANQGNRLFFADCIDQKTKQLLINWGFRETKSYDQYNTYLDYSIKGGM